MIAKSRDRLIAKARKRGAAPIEASAINVMGTARDAKRLAAFAAQEGAAALTLLEEASTLLAALAECASLNDIPRIEALIVRAERADFYTACIDRVRTRASALL